jgi:TolA-binding protein
MSRRRGQSELAPSLFPFLAVLLCTMGALVFMLIMTVSNAGAMAKQVVAAEKSEESQIQEEELHVVVEQLKAERVRANEMVENMRGKLQSFEQQIVELTDELKQLKEKEAAVRNQSSLTEQQRADKESELENLRAQREKIEKEIADKKNESANKPPAFAILPYQGPNGTTRRPIYLECTAEGLVIQPEGIVLSLRDLAPPHGPGNPLDAALRTIRSHYQELDASTSSYSAPYPLLIVRPSGVKTFAMARGAMSGWDDQFGYELVDAKMPLAYPPSSQGLKPQVEDSIVAARQRQSALVAALPRQVYNPDQLEELLAKPLGSNQLGPNQGADQSLGTIDDPENWKVISEMPAGTELSMGGSGSRRSTTNGLPGNENLFDNLLGSNMAKSLAQDLTQQQMRGSQGSMPGENATGLRSSSTGTGTSGTGTTETGLSGTAGNGPSSQSNANGMEGNPNLSSSGQSGSGSSVPNGSPMSPSPNDPTQSNPNAGDALRDPPSLSISQSFDKSEAQNGNIESQLKPISVSQGKDWATARSEGKATAITRTINMVVLPNAWVLITDNNRREAEATIRLADGVIAGSNQLSRLIKKRVEDWGVAVAGGYWKPRLTIETPSENLDSLKILQRLLEGSGMDVQVIPLQAAVPANVPR